MARYVAFLRGINVGSHIVKMDTLRKVFEREALENVKTFIASGNVLFDSGKSPAALEKLIATALRKELGYEVATFVRSASEVAAIAEHQVYDAADLTHGSLFVGMLPEAVDARDRKIIASLESPVDTLRAHKREVYWHARANFRDAQFAPAKMEKLLGKPATFRNINTVKRIAALLAKVTLAIALLTVTATAQWDGPVRRTDASDVLRFKPELLSRWIEAVERHRYGEADEAVAFLQGWSREDFRDAWGAINLLARLFDNDKQRTFFIELPPRRVLIQISAQDRSATLKKVVHLQQRPGRGPFFKAAAILHTDAARFAPPDGVASQPISFLSPVRSFVETDDGTNVGRKYGDVNWEFARLLLSNVPNARQDADVRDWYRATLSNLLATEHLDSPQFDEATRLFPNDPEILMLDGCLHEVYADPRVQEVLDSFDARERGNFSMRSEVGELRLAADQFEEALKHAPAHPEARLRWGRTLGRLGRHQDAVVELRTARDRLDESMLKYYAELFVGAEEEAVGNLTTAERAYQNARSLFPMAQAPVLALSQLAHRRGERSEARRIIAEPLAAATTDEDDPWWTYDVSCGRRAEEIYDSVYQRVAELQPR